MLLYVLFRRCYEGGLLLELLLFKGLGEGEH
jgi:hypothetical protein